MKLLFFLALLGPHATAAVTHSMNYFYKASSGFNDLPDFPEFVIVGFVDGVRAFHYDSDTMKAEPQQAWMINATTDQHDFWWHQTDDAKEAQQAFKTYLDTAKQRFNHTGGVHVLQWMSSCQWDDETNQATGFDEWHYDGKAYKPYEPMMEALNDPPNPQHEWENDYIRKRHGDKALINICPGWLKVYLDHGRRSLLGTALPSVSLLQKTPSSPVICHATGFSPRRASIFWREDGEELHEDVDRGAIFPNHDGTFRMSVDLDLSSVPPEDWTRYDCVFRLAGVKDIITKLERDRIRTNWAPPSVSLLQKTPSSPVICHATGFSPRRASIFWREDGQRLSKDVDRGAIFPNLDGTFQMSVDLDLSSVPPEDWTRYDCVFQLAGVKEDIVTKLEKDRIRTNWELPSVSLLQKTPSSPVSCHATGFYPDRASIFWREDGQRLSKDVDHGEIFPNLDGTFQMSVDLDLSSVTPEGWTRYDCVFRRAGVKDIVTKLEKDRIRTNWVTHSLKYFYTASSGLPNFPEFVIFGFVDGVQAFRYDSDTMKAEPQQAWMKTATVDQHDFWCHQTDDAEEAQWNFKTNLDTAKQWFNHTGGVHVLQWMYGCELDDETNQAITFDKWFYDGKAYKPYEPVMEALNDPPNPQHYIEIVHRDKTLINICPGWLKVYLDHGRRSLLGTVPPSVSLLQKTPSSPVICHTTELYDRRAALFWRKDGQRLSKDVDRGTYVRKRHGTFRMSVDLDLSSVPPEDWTRYDCVFWLDGLEYIVTKLEKDRIRTNWAVSSPEDMVGEKNA